MALPLVNNAVIHRSWP